MKSEDILGKKWDKCIGDTGILMGTGIAIGAFISLFLKKKVLPMTLGAGIGLGLAYQKCETTVTSFSVKDFGKVVKDE